MTPTPALPASAEPLEPLPPGGRSALVPISTTVPLPAEAPGRDLPGVQLSQRPRRRGDTFGWPANAAPGKPEGEVDTRP